MIRQMLLGTLLGAMAVAFAVFAAMALAAGDASAAVVVARPVVVSRPVITPRATVAPRPVARPDSARGVTPDSNGSSSSWLSTWISTWAWMSIFSSKPHPGAKDDCQKPDTSRTCKQ